MSRVPLRLWITLGFSLAAAVVFVALGGFLHQRFGAELDRSVRDGLRQRAGDLSRQLADGMRLDLRGNPQIEPGDDVIQILSRRGAVLQATPGFGGAPLLDGGRLARAASHTTTLERVDVGDEDGAYTAVATPAGSAVLVVATATEPRDEALANLDGLLLGGVPIAIVLASACGYLIAGRALRPIERIRARTEAIGAGDLSQRLPEPRADDEAGRLARTLNGMLDRLQAAFDRERAFVGDASHELRTPLARLKAELELARRPGRSPADIDEAIDSSSAEVDHLVRLTDDLLVLARADHGSLPLQRERVRLRDVITAAARRTGTQATLVVEGPRDLELHTDPLRLQQVIGNLLDNAVRHGAGAPILSVRVEGRDLVVAVSDEGPGIPPQLRERAFERFTRADTARAADGSGLGLSIVAAVAAAHGGHAWIGPGGDVRVRLAAAVTA